MKNYYYSVDVDEPNAHEVLEHVVRASLCGVTCLYINGRPLDRAAVTEVVTLVEAVLPELYRQAVELEELIESGEIERRCGHIGKMSS